MSEEITISKPWQKFLSRLEKEYKTIPQNEWKAIHILSYICERYERLYKIKYVVAIAKAAPSKCTEMFIVNKLFFMLNTIDAVKVKDYVDWVFDKKIIPKKMRINKLSLFIAAGITNEYLLETKKAKRLTRSLPVQPSYIAIANELGIQIETYGDLAFLLLALEKDMKNDLDAAKKTNNYLLLKNLEIVGLNWDSLRNLEA